MNTSILLKLITLDKKCKLAKRPGNFSVTLFGQEKTFLNGVPKNVELCRFYTLFGGPKPTIPQTHRTHFK